MAYEHRYPVVLVCSGTFNPVTTAHIKMFEIARSFLERSGRHIVISGVISPTVTSQLSRDGDDVTACESHRVTMCRLAVQQHHWLTVDTWQSSQLEQTKPTKLLRRISNKLRSEYGFPSPFQNTHHFNDQLNSSRFGSSHAVRLQPDGSFRNHVMTSQRREIDHVYDVRNCNVVAPPSNYTKHPRNNNNDNNGDVMDILGLHFQRVCCGQPPAFNYQNDNLAFGAAYDLRRTKVMLLCGADDLEKFGDEEQWTDQEIREILECFGLVCIPRNIQRDSDEVSGMRRAFDRLQGILSEQPGTVILVNDNRKSEISKISSKKCREAFYEEDYTTASEMLDTQVFSYINKFQLYRYPDSATDNPVGTSNNDVGKSSKMQTSQTEEHISSGDLGIRRNSFA